MTVGVGEFIFCCICPWDCAPRECGAAQNGASSSEYGPCLIGAVCRPSLLFPKRLITRDCPEPGPEFLLFELLDNFGRPKFVQIWWFWCRWKADDEIYPNLAKTKLSDHPKFAKIQNFDFRVKDPKFGFRLGLRIWNFQFLQNFASANLTKNKNSATVVYCNVSDINKIRKSNFSKIGPKLGYTDVTRFFQNFEVHRDQNPQNSFQNWLQSPKKSKIIILTLEKTSQSASAMLQQKT